MTHRKSKALGRKVASMIKLMGATQKEIAEQLRLNPSTLSRMLKGEVPVQRHLPKIQEIFDDWAKVEVRRLELTIDLLKSYSSNLKNETTIISNDVAASDGNGTVQK